MRRVDDAAKEIADQCLGLRVRLLDRAVTAVYDKRLRPVGLRITQLTLLTAIARAGELGPGELGRHLHMEKSTVSRTVDRLMQNGWVEALEIDDARSYRVRLTEAGRAKLAEAHPHWKAAHADVEALLGQPSAAALRSVADSVQSESG